LAVRLHDVDKSIPIDPLDTIVLMDYLGLIITGQPRLGNLAMARRLLDLEPTCAAAAVMCTQHDGCRLAPHNRCAG